MLRELLQKNGDEQQSKKAPFNVKDNEDIKRIVIVTALNSITCTVFSSSYSLLYGNVHSESI